MSRSVEEDVKDRIDAIEAAYEYMLAYAAQGVTGEEEAGSGAEIRAQVERFQTALEGLSGLIRDLFAARGVGPAQAYATYIDVLDRDAASTRAALQLVLARSAISSQLIDNVNALMHLRSFLTDLFFIGEILGQ